LGDGERAALALAMERDADLVVLDDQEGRRIAKQRDLSVTGTIGVLVEARANGYIDSLRWERSDQVL
jgi:predicted nucleic acid-binding protein